MLSRSGMPESCSRRGSPWAVNLLVLPSVAVAVGVSDCVPQGVQVIGSRYREDLCLNAAETMEPGVRF